MDSTHPDRLAPAAPTGPASSEPRARDHLRLFSPWARWTGAPSPAGTAAARKQLLIWALVLAGLTGLSSVWILSPLHDLFHPQAWLSAPQSFATNPAAPWLVLGGFLVGTILILPITAMVILTVAACGPVAGFVYALGGTTLSALMSFAIGRRLGRRQLDLLTGSRLHTVSLKLRSAGVIAIAAVRMVPIAHFTVVSLVAGVSHIRLRDFIVGTILGMAPGIGVIAIFFDQLTAAARASNPEHLLWLAAISLTILGTLALYRRFTRSH